MKEKIAIIDIGSNTIRLVIYEKSKVGSSFKEIENIKNTYRLRKYLSKQQLLKKEGINLLIKSLQSFKLVLNVYEVTQTICVATATIRQAENKEEIMQIVQQETGYSICILDEYEEAYYGYLAATHALDISEGITFDMGGGSTELTYFKHHDLVHYTSLPFGALSLKLQFVKGDVPTEQELLQIRHYIRSELENLPWIANKHIPIIAMGGSVRNVAQLHQNIIHYPLADIHQYEMEVSDILAIKDKIKPFTLTNLQNVDGLSKDRADTILPAFEFFEILGDISKTTKFIVSRQGLREGVLLSKWANKKENDFAPWLNPEIFELMQEYHIDPKKGEQIKRIANLIFHQMKEIKGIGEILSTSDLELLNKGAGIFRLGKYLNDESSPYTFYILINLPMSGLSHQDRVKLALISSFKGRDTFRQYIQPFKNWFTKEERKKLCLLGVLLRLSQCLNKTERNIVHDIKITSVEERLMMNVECHHYYAPEQYELEKQKKLIEKLFKIKLVSQFHLINR
ncbi:Ppx/GppA family phosphatase [Bacillus sp. BRMEA1]|uniref:Ppx/GppA family phosphatase n=1 Tax=Neobacillus endophyticus TaxID=2738405 RepID=UPI0015652DA3|nr:Ppx/GppA family phosphatase [Neobacillus endophyticus]NRD80246.1 Ppx/GppA family phosphatase [Neobacillus endophyticus]